MKTITNIITIIGVSLVSMALQATEKSDNQWVSVTIDNDAFVGNDSGYSNGLFISTFDINATTNKKSSNDFWVKPLMWSMPNNNLTHVVNSYSFGQSLNTPSDIKIKNPSKSELPYSALLAMSNSYITISPEVADIAITTLGVVGSIAFGKEVQSSIHNIIGANKPQGWHTQIKNEVVFELNRGRSYRVWTTEQDNFDILLNSRGSIGTIETSIDIGTYFRYGNNLAQSHPTTLLATSRISNPIAIKGWYLFFGTRWGYMFNHIAVDGNTFRDSRSIDYQHRYVSLSTGFAYTWNDLSVTLAINDFNILQENEGEAALADLTEFGTISFSWRL